MAVRSATAARAAIISATSSLFSATSQALWRRAQRHSARWAPVRRSKACSERA